MENIVITKKMLNKSTIRVAVVFLFLVLMVIAFISVTFAWFASNKNVEASGMQIRVDAGSDLSVEGIDCYPVTAISGNNYAFIETPDNYDYGLPTEDPSEIEVSEYEHAIIVHIACNIPDGKTAELLLHCDMPWYDNSESGPNSMGNYPDQNVAEKLNYLSNVIQVSTGTNNAGICTKNSSEQSFVSNTQTAATSKAMTLNLGTFVSGTTDIYIIIEYKKELVDYFSTDPIIEYESIAYKNDLEFEIKEAE